jgi:hypothetical protein
MSVSGVCQICEGAEATHRCDRCGNLVCAEHFDARTGYCADCMRTVGSGENPNDGFEF